MNTIPALQIGSERFPCTSSGFEQTATTVQTAYLICRFQGDFAKADGEAASLTLSPAVTDGKVTDAALVPAEPIQVSWTLNLSEAATKSIAGPFEAAYDDNAISIDNITISPVSIRFTAILFPELEKLVPTLHMASVYALLNEFPGAKQIASAHLTRLTNLLHEASKGRYGREKAIQIRDTARKSIGSAMPAKSLELKHTIHLIGELDAEIAEIETEIDSIMETLHSPITTIPGIGSRMGAMILAEVGDFSNFDSADKILAYAGLSPSTYQSGQLTSSYAHMEKRGSRYLRYAIFNATKFVCNWDPIFAAYLAKKRGEGKHYNVAISHAAKKLVRLIYAMEQTGQPYRQAAV